MGATRNTGYIENLIAYDGNNNIGVGGPVNVLYKVTIGGNTLISGNLNVTGTITFSSNVTANSFVKNGGVATEFLKADGTVDTSTYATVSYVDTSISNLIDAAPAALNTLNELAAALGDDSSFSTTVTTALGNRLRIDTDAQGLTSEQKANGRTNLGVVIGTDVQAYDADLGAIAALTGTSGFLKKTAANTWTLDTNTYLTSYTETDTLATVTGRGASTTTAISINSASVDHVTLANRFHFIGSSNFHITNNAYYNAAFKYQTAAAANKITIQSDGAFIFDYAASGTIDTNITWTTVFSVSNAGTATASSFVKSGGTSSQYLMADGSVSTLTNLVTGSATSGQIAYWNGNNTITGSSQFTFGPQSVFLINNSISAGGIAVNLVSTVNAAANNDIIYGLRISPTFSNGSFTGVTQRALGVFGDVYINGSITSGSWQGSTITVAKGGTGLTALGTANQLIRVNSGATALEYFTPTYLTSYTETDTLASVTGRGASTTSSLSFNAVAATDGTGDYTNATTFTYKISPASSYWRIIHLSAHASVSGVYTYQTGKSVYWGEDTDTGDYIFRGRTLKSGSNVVWHAGNLTNLNQLTNGPGYITSSGTASAINQTVAAGTSADLIYSTIATNDFFRIRVGGAVNEGFVEIATADDGTEPILVRQYTGIFATLTRTLTLLDGSGNTSIPGDLTVSGTNFYASTIAYIGNTNSTPSSATGWNGSSVARLQSGSTGGNVYLEFRTRADVGDYAGLIFTDNNNGGYIAWRNYVGAGANDGTNGDYMLYGTYTDHIFQAGSSNSINGKSEVFRMYANGNARVMQNFYIPSGSLFMKDSGPSIYENRINAGWNSTGDAIDMWINYEGYQNSNGYFRDFRVGNGKRGSAIMFIDGSEGTTAFSGQVTLSGPLVVDYSNAYLWVKSVNSGSGVQWHDQIWLGRYDRIQTAAQYPNYLPGVAYGIHITQTSDAAFFGLIDRGSAYNSYNCVIAWGDDAPEDVFQYRFNNNVIGTITPSGALTMSSDITAFSDIRIKENITTIDNALEKVLKLRGVYYNRTDLKFDKSKKVGFIAQEVQDVIPEIVTYDEQIDRYAVTYGNTVAILVEAIKEQQKQIEELKSQIKNK